MKLNKIFKGGKKLGKKDLEDNFLKIIEGLPGSEKINSEVFENTPRRVLDFYEEIFSGLTQNPENIIKNRFPMSYDGIIVEKNIDFHSMCEHHFLPFFGKISIGYIPDGYGVGFGDIIKVIDIFSKRPQLQERLTQEIADLIYKTLECKGVCVHIEAEHLCMTMRGVKKPGTKILSFTGNGVFKDELKKQEFLSLIK